MSLKSPTIASGTALSIMARQQPGAPQFLNYDLGCSTSEIIITATSISAISISATSISATSISAHSLDDVVCHPERYHNVTDRWWSPDPYPNCITLKFVNHTTKSHRSKSIILYGKLERDKAIIIKMMSLGSIMVLGLPARHVQ